MHRIAAVQRFRQALVLATGVVAGACSVDRLDMPTPPDLSGWIESYDHPTAPFDQAVVHVLAKDLGLKLKTLDPLGGLEKLWSDVVDPSVLVAAPPMAEPGEAPRGPFGLEDKGYAQVRHICRDGDGKEAGSIELWLTFHNRRLDPVLWGSADVCVLPTPKGALRLDGDLSVAYRERIIVFTGTVTVNDTPLVDGLINLRINDGVETVLPVGEQSLVLRVAKDDSGFRAQNGFWRCEFPSGDCVTANSAAVVSLREITP
jgi:hypothetical protein